MTSITYSKRSGTSGIRGQLYETKLISLINYRLKHNGNIKEYALATNMDNIGIFDDICLRFKVKELDKPLAVFIQAKHREHDTLLKNDWATYFDSYMKIKQAFTPTTTDLIFKGQYDEIECFFVIYTTARGDDNNETLESPYTSSLNNVIATAQGGQQITAKNKDVEDLYKIIIKEQVAQLAKPIAKLFFDEVTDFQIFMSNEHVFTYHVILAQRFCEVSDIQPGKYRLARVRPEFFDTDDEILTTFKNSLYKEVIGKRRVSDSEFESQVTQFFNNPTDVTILSKVIGCVVTYKNGKLEFVNNKMINDDLKRQLRNVHIPDVILDQAVELAGREILASKQYIKVPAAFGNKDLVVRKNERLTYLASKISLLINKSDHNHVITIDESVDKGFLKLNGGIASAVGNLLVLDEDSKMLKFNGNSQELGDVAKRLLTIIKQNEIVNLDKYRIHVKIKTFPKLTFDCGAHDKNVAQDFFNRILLYTNQADENGTGKILKREIEKYRGSFLSHMIFLKYHDDIQNWWMSPNKAVYLTEESNIYANAMNTVAREPPMTVMNKMYEIKTKEANIVFNHNVMNSLELTEQPGYIVITESILLTLYKVKQYLQEKNHIVLDMKYIVALQIRDFKTLIAELNTTNTDKIIIIVFHNILEVNRELKGKIEKIAEKLKNKMTIIITDSELLQIVQNMFLEAYNVVNDDKTNLTDFTEDTQHSILQKKIRFQGQEIKLKSIVDETSKSFVKGEILTKIIHNETILLGEVADMSNCDTVHNMYIGRRVCRNKKRDLPVMRIHTEDDTLIRLKHLQYATCTTQIKDNNTKSLKSKLDEQQQESLHIDTLHDIDDDVVVLTTKPGMGKSTLFTHLFLQTKKVDQTMWIVRINLIEHCKQFCRWKQNKTVIDILECLHFICAAMLGKTDQDAKFAFQERNNELCIDYCSGDALLVFELKMFLHFYNRKKMVFLFDGLDEVWPNYADEVLLLFKILKNYPKHIKHKIWITSRPNAKINTILEKEFDVPYDLENYSWIEQNMFLYMFWIKNEILLNNNETQLENIYDFINFMSQSPDIKLFLQNNRPSELNEKPHLSVYINFICYLKVELRSAPPRITTALSALYDRCLAYITIVTDFMTTPLNLYLIAHYFLNEIKSTRLSSENWHFEINPVTFYVNFLSNKLKIIRLKHLTVGHIMKLSFDKSELKPIRKEYEEVISYDPQRNYEIHKKLAAYAVFHDNLVTVFDLHELTKIKNLIKILKYENQKTAIIHNVVNDIPVFIHETIAEYLAVEYICDKLKGEELNLIVELLLGVLDGKPNVKVMFESKLKEDSQLKAIVDRNKKETCVFNSNNKRMKLK
ncbi:hypothetical protein PYW07_013278 [Mythimna separata]|uniref:Nephrocystin 3-like N-terminal domain-containing protein n=1 Tax=Mythimna separata TaxID=271217 RepID=A0AAD7Y6A2_MYTSE|nr:hypothetical protein PYW07_013278 [Mythimna separata]